MTDTVSSGSPAATQLNRRTALIGALASTGALAVPGFAFAKKVDGLAGLPRAAIHARWVAAAMAMPEVMGRWSVTIKSGDPDQPIDFHQQGGPSHVEAAIEAHRKAWAASAAALNCLSDARDCAPDLPDAGVQVGTLLHASPDGSPLPLIAYSLEEIWQRAPRFTLLRDYTPEERQAWVDEKSLLLAKAKQARSEAEDKYGITAARAAHKLASDAELEARFALVVALPRTTAEAEAKAAYLAQAEPFTEGYCSDDPGFVERLVAALCSVRT